MAESNSVVRNLVKSFGSGISESVLENKRNSVVKEGLGLLTNGLTELNIDSDKNKEQAEVNITSEQEHQYTNENFQSDCTEVENQLEKDNLENNIGKEPIEQNDRPTPGQEKKEENSVNFSNKIILIDRSDGFLDLISKERCLVQYTAKWCAPSKRIAPVLNELAHSNPGIKFLEIDIDESKRTSKDLVSHITNVPYFELYANGEKIDEFFGDNLIKIKKGVAFLNS
ncbi:unnamed protein product [Brachionus calyciflorus]|uniref:Thioredoxin domain-containing protein n=1 Tax=Brachionus calyciflorus TaxID=104777 RepID=A0A813YLN2_9BILA|nr:unnamed protein product [Brachionus calyciflorus]